MARLPQMRRLNISPLIIPPHRRANMADHRRRFSAAEKKNPHEKKKKTSLSLANLIAEG